ncbi:MAG TPA: dihydrofolate reductase family protein [Ktedonobacterales bacterium]|nr:dihydrofolate reductase family protein [Ktedonobacterales bacterium]
MGKVIVANHVTLDGVMQSPARPDEDTRDGFAHGGWAIPGNDPEMARVMGEGMGEVGGYLFGRRTYEDFYSVWANRTDNPFSEAFDKTQKYVASTTLEEPLPWRNSSLLTGDAAEAVAQLKEQSEKNLVIFGSGELIQSLMRSALIDRYVLMIHPLILGSGRRLFADGGAFATLRLVNTFPTATGVVIATYERAER